MHNPDLPSELPLEALSHDPWLLRVWQAVRCIPHGQVATYGQIAALVGFPKRARHVGAALKALPDELDIPWFRVVGASGKISLPQDGMSFHKQRVLLEAEGVIFKPNGRIELKRYQWNPLAGEI